MLQEQKTIDHYWYLSFVQYSTVGVASQWPAMEKWKEANYLPQTVGNKAKVSFAVIEITRPQVPQRVFASDDNLHFLANKGVSVEQMNLEQVLAHINSGGWCY